MTIRETAMPSLREASPTASFANAKLQQLSEPLLQEVTDFIDFVIHKYQVEIADSHSDETLVGKWSQWFEAVDYLDISPSEPARDYQQLLLNKYRQQGLEL